MSGEALRGAWAWAASSQAAGGRSEPSRGGQAGQGGGQRAGARSQGAGLAPLAPLRGAKAPVGGNKYLSAHFCQVHRASDPNGCHPWTYPKDSEKGSFLN